ncbi:MAG: hypothetical protein E7262_06765 [Lachnospiraceae bacterium]|nr:hypothetical protein [Lachnospiraceae bacterium]
MDGYQLFKEKVTQLCEKHTSKDLIITLNNDDTESKITYGDLYETAKNFKEIMERNNLVAGDRIIIIDNHSPSNFVTFISAAFHNLTVAFIDPGLPIDEQNYFIDFLDPRAIFTNKKIVNNINEEYKCKYPILNNRNTSYKDISGYDKHEKLPATLDPDNDCIAILLSSGTTSRMKAVLIRYSSYMKALRICETTVDMKENSKQLITFPLYHVSGLLTSSTSFYSGATINMLEEFTPSILSKALQYFEPTHFCMIPKVYDVIGQKLLQTIEEKGGLIKKYYKFANKTALFFREYFNNPYVGHTLMAPFSKPIFGKNITALGVSGALCVESVAEIIYPMATTWCYIYASTEALVPISSSVRQDKYPICHIGLADRNPEIDIKINNPNEEGIGEIYVKSELIMKGYFREPELTAAAFDGEYFKTGDLGYIGDHGHLHITGRAKESILLHTGKKVSPNDLEDLLSPVVGNYGIAVCGILDKEYGFDRIHVFIEAPDLNDQKRFRLTDDILDYAQKNMPMYPIASVHYVDTIPRTSIGKPKRFLLIKNLENNKTLNTTSLSTDKETTNNETQDLETRILNIFKKFSNIQEEITPKHRFREELNLDSLSMYEISIEIERVSGIFIGEILNTFSTIRDIIDYVNDPSDITQPEPAYNIQDFPKKKKLRDKMLLSIVKGISKFNWIFKVKGLENIPNKGNYILCPNHQSHLDGLWTFMCMGNKRPPINKIACMAKQEHLESKFMTSFLRALGGIPVDRSGNSAPAMQRSEEWLSEGGYMLIHPEGTRTKDGYLGTFKSGAAKLAINTNTPIVPVVINGAYHVYPANKKLPRFRKPFLKRLAIEIIFQKPIYPTDTTAFSLTNKIEESIKKEIDYS